MRRWLIVVAVTAAALTAAMIGCGPSKTTTNSSAPANRMVVVSWGGELQDVEREVFFRPFSAKQNVTVDDIAFTGEYAKIKAQVESGRIEWDVVEVDSDISLSAGREGLLEPIDYSVVRSEDLLPEAKGQYGVGVFYISTALVWNQDRIPQGAPQPTSWRDLWDMKKYPGKRTLRKDPRTTLEIALLADGVAPENLYPLDVDRALRKLSEVKSEVVWWSSGSEFQQKILSECALGSGWNGRVLSLQRQGKPVRLNFNQGILDLDWWVVLRGANKERAMQFINYSIQPDPQRQLAEKMGYGPVSAQAASAISPDLQAMIPTAPQNKTIQLRLNTEWWAENEKKVREKWEAWLLQ